MIYMQALRRHWIEPSLELPYTCGKGGEAMVEHISDLLEELQSLVGCEYLSDLSKNQQYNQQAKILLLRMEPTRYPLKQWSDAVEYILAGNEKDL